MRRYQSEARDERAFALCLFTRADDRLIGGITLSNIRRGVTQTATLGYWVGEPYQSRGYITEAVRLIVRFGFQQLKLHRIEAACLPENTASRRVLEKGNFVREGYARLYLRIAGDWRDHLTFAMLQEDFEAQLAARPE